VPGTTGGPVSAVTWEYPPLSDWRNEMVNNIRLRGIAWWGEQLGPVFDQVRAHGVRRAVPASALLALASLGATAVARVASPIQGSAAGFFTYRGRDLYAGAVWKLPASGLLAQSRPQWCWTLLVAAVVFAALEVRVGWMRLLVCVLLSQTVPTVMVALLAPLCGHAELLSRPDYGTSCLVVGATAALAWVRRSALLALVIAISLAADAVLSAHATAVEHCLAVSIGALVIMSVEDRSYPAGLPRPVSRALATAAARSGT
jgi:hypothetical protein